MWLELAGDAGVAFGFYVVFLTFRANTFTAGTVRVEEGQQVISSGPYGWIRHPMYAGASLGLLATPLALGSPRSFLWAILLVLVIAIRLLREERYLKTNLPGYEGYCRKGRWRLVPWIW